MSDVNPNTIAGQAALSSAFAKFNTALELLVTSDDPLRKRLTDAADTIFYVEKDHLPTNIREQLLVIRAWAEKSTELDQAELEGFAKQILDTYTRIVQELEKKPDSNGS